MVYGTYYAIQPTVRVQVIPDTIDLSSDNVRCIHTQYLVVIDSSVKERNVRVCFRFYMARAQTAESDTRFAVRTTYIFFHHIVRNDRHSLAVGSSMMSPAGFVQLLFHASSRSRSRSPRDNLDLDLSV